MAGTRTLPSQVRHFSGESPVTAALRASHTAHGSSRPASRSAAGLPAHPAALWRPSSGHAPARGRHQHSREQPERTHRSLWTPAWTLTAQRGSKVQHGKTQGLGLGSLSHSTGSAGPDAATAVSFAAQGVSVKHLSIHSSVQEARRRRHSPFHSHSAEGGAADRVLVRRQGQPSRQSVCRQTGAGILGDLPCQLHPSAGHSADHDQRSGLRATGRGGRAR